MTNNGKEQIFTVTDGQNFSFSIRIIPISPLGGIKFVPVFPRGKPLKQKHNDCPKNCPMFRSDRGCISTVCIRKLKKPARG